MTGMRSGSRPRPDGLYATQPLVRMHEPTRHRQEHETTMKTASHARPRVKLIARLLVVPALLIAGYAGMQLAPLVHSTAANAAPHVQMADVCPSSGARCP
jgi:hypothetical protein